MQQMKRYINKDKLIMFAILAGVCVALYFLDTGCTIKWLTGVSCPGCGMTRAYLSLIRLDFKSAFYYHPLFLVALPSMIFIIFSKKPLFNNKKYQKIFYISLIILFILTYLYRLIFIKSDVVSIDFENSYIMTLIRMLKVWM